MLHKILLSTLFLFSSACYTPIPVYVDEKESDEFVEASYSAIEWWNDQLNYDSLVLKVTKNTLIKTVLFPTGAILLKTQKDVGRFRYLAGVTYNILPCSLVKIRKDLNDYPNGTIITIAHELGHAFGLKHNKDDPNNLMWPSCCANGQMKITDTQRRWAKTVSILRQ